MASPSCEFGKLAGALGLELLDAHFEASLDMAIRRAAVLVG